jgi:hypothetical protein
VEVICSSKTLANFHWTTWRYIPEDGTLQIYILFFYLMVTTNELLELGCGIWYGDGSLTNIILITKSAADGDDNLKHIYNCKL